MAGGRDTATVHALRALAHPLAVGSLVLLALNDHVLKQAWPGWVTGKLSDVAGLVVAPLVLALPLGWLRVRRPELLAVLLTGAGFTAVKTTAVGAAAASATWSAVAGPSYLRPRPDRPARPARAAPRAAGAPAGGESDPAAATARDRRRGRGGAAVRGAGHRGHLAVRRPQLEPQPDRARGPLGGRVGRLGAGAADRVRRAVRPGAGRRRPRGPGAVGRGARSGHLRRRRPRAGALRPGAPAAVLADVRPDPVAAGGPDGCRDRGGVRVARRRAHLVGGDGPGRGGGAGGCATRRGRCAGSRSAVGTGGLAVLSGDPEPVVVVSLGGLGIAVRDATGGWTRIAEDRIEDIAVPVAEPVGGADPGPAARGPAAPDQAGGRAAAGDGAALADARRTRHPPGRRASCRSR